MFINVTDPQICQTRFKNHIKHPKTRLDYRFVLNFGLWVCFYENPIGSARILAHNDMMRPLVFSGQCDEPAQFGFGAFHTWIPSEREHESA